MRYSIYCLVLFFAIGLWSCDSNEDLQELQVENDWRSADEHDKDGHKCFELVYPVTYIMPDGSTVTGADRDEVRANIKAWYDAHPDVTEKPELQYPVDVILLRTDEQITIADADEMHRLKRQCHRPDRPGDHWQKCFEFVYPVTYIMPDGSTVTGADQDEVRANIKAWYDAHPDVTEKPELQYPVDVILLRNDEQITIANADEMRRLKQRCHRDRPPQPGDHARRCFDLVYPVTYIMPDGSTVTGADAAELRAIIKAWYDAHPDVTERATLQYPVDVILRNGTELTIDNADEMKRLLRRCHAKRPHMSDRPHRCFDFVYPITYVMPDGSTVTGADAEEVRMNIAAWYDAHPDVSEKPDLQFPIEIIYEDDTIETTQIFTVIWMRSQPPASSPVTP